VRYTPLLDVANDISLVDVIIDVKPLARVEVPLGCAIECVFLVASRDVDRFELAQWTLNAIEDLAEQS
jgi:hypothetical protein